MRYRSQPTLMVLAVTSTFLALGAAHIRMPPAGPHEFKLGRIGNHRLLKDARVFEHRGEMYVVRFEEFPIKEKLGTLSFEGNIVATPLKQVLEGPQPVTPGGAPEPRQAAPKQATPHAKR
jgi:hypothetical protein